VVFEVRQGAVEVVAQERAPRTTRGPVWAEHEVVDDQLAAAVEELAQRFPARRRVKGVLLVDQYPRQRKAFRIDLVAQPGCFLFAGQKPLALGEPLFA
jgi:hypothetical protein